MILLGERVTIRRTTIADLPNLMTLWNDGQVTQWVGFPHGLGFDSEKTMDWFRSLESDSERHHFVVSAEGLGFCGEIYYAVDKLHRRAALDIKFVPKAQGHGLAAEALNALIWIVFESEPNVDAVWTEPVAQNISAQRLYRRCGLTPKPRPVDMEQGPSYWELRRKA